MLKVKWTCVCRSDEIPGPYKVVVRRYILGKVARRCNVDVTLISMMEWAG